MFYKLTFQSFFSHRAMAAKPGGGGPKSTQRATDMYMENCVVHIKIAVLAIVAFANAGIYISAMQRAMSSKFAAKTQTNKCEIQRNLKKYFCHLFAWTVTYSKVSAHRHQLMHSIVTSESISCTMYMYMYATQTSQQFQGLNLWNGTLVDLFI